MMMLLSLASKRRAAWFLITVLVAQLFTPYQSFALTGGPSQPEVQSFEPIGTSEMVDVSSGSFTYNIPLLEVGGYPINLAYHSGIGMDDEASCMGGLGWNINVGVINRNMRGLPDDFKGDDVKKSVNMKANETWGGKLGVAFEIFGMKPEAKATGKLGITLGGFWNNYKGVGLEFGIAPSFSAGEKGKPKANLGLGLSANSSSGVNFSPQFGMNFSSELDKKSKQGDQGALTSSLSVGAGYNTRKGLQALTFGATLGIGGSGQRYNNRKGKWEDVGSGRSLYGGSATYDFVAPTYSPGGQFSFTNLAFCMAFTIGGEIWGNHPSISTTGYYSTQFLREKGKTSPAFGYLYAQHGQKAINELQDFNREKDMAFNENTPNLPLPVHTSDIYSAAGQGIAGSYQLKRGDVGVVADPICSSSGFGHDVSGEVGLGNTAHVGVDIAFNFNSSRSGAWTDDNKATGSLAFQDKIINDPFEPAFFKIAGEKSVEDDPTFLTDIGGTQPVQLGLTSYGGTSSKFVRGEGNWSGSTKSFPAHMYRGQREKRNQPISYLTARQARDFGLEKDIYSFQENIYGQYVPPAIAKTIPREDATRKAHHLSEVTVLRQDGLRYLYGIPAYNNEQVEVGFSVGDGGDCSSGLTTYSGKENTKDNGSGTDHYFSKTELPPYAHAWLLTAVLSPDYVDVTGDGPTPDDLGTYTYFRYTQIHENYRWRAPYGLNSANFNEGYKSDPGDNKANYLYGKKNIWYLQSAESKTQLAEFYYGARNDGLGVAGEDGGPDATQSLKKLEKIVLFSLPDRRQNGANAEPIKTVHFDYNYELLPGIPNNLTNGGGKLTLKALSFTFGKSQKGKLSPYKFEYNNQSGGNYTYNIRNYNRWGTFQPNTSGSDCMDVANTPLSNSDFPYVHQDNRTQQDQYAAWMNLKKIYLPSGGVIEVEYEANDYAFVQNSRAMEMVKILGFAKDENAPLTSELYKYNLLTQSPENYNCLFFQLPSGQEFPAPTDAAARAEIERRYLKDDPSGGRDILGEKGFLYFKCLINLNKDGATPKYEFVPGYTKIEDFGALKNSTTGKYDRAFLKLEKVCSRDKEKVCNSGLGNWLNPVTKGALNFARLNLPQIAYGEPNPTASGDKQIAQAVGALVLQFGQMFKGFNQKMVEKGFARQIEPDKSWIRLFSPTGKKIGGGVRVKSIRIRDAWDQMAGTPHKPAEYGQEYSYTTEEWGQTISSGVATYEPLIGGDENPVRQPIFYKEAFLLAPDNNHYQEAPYGESFFPSAQVVYSEVRVQNLTPAGVTVTRHGTGHTVYKYYTARDFPTKFTTTGAQAIPKRSSPVFTLLKIKSWHNMTASQGYAVELNDMAGKPKKQEVYDQSGALISSIAYNYKTDAQGLNNEAQVILPDGKLATKTIGLEVSMIADSRESSTSMTNLGIQLNFDGFLTGIFPTLAVIPWPSYTREETLFRSIVTSKVVHRYGLLQSTTAYDLGSTVSTENLAWDAETGEVILTKTYNEHDDPVYNLNFPAHWAYKGMRAAYKNLGLTFNGKVTNGDFQVTNAGKSFMTGDEVAITNGGFSQKGWVKAVVNNNWIYIIDQSGQPIHTGNTLCDVEVIRSGYRNQQLSSIGSATTLQLPVDASGKLNFQNKQVLNASATQFDERWQTWCGTKSLANTCACQTTHTGPAPGALLALLQNQFAAGKFVQIPKTAPLNISGLPAYGALLPYIDAQCGAGYPGTNNHLFASELVGNDLVIYFGKFFNEKPTCWFPCVTIPNFGVMMNTGTIVTGFSGPLSPNLNTCDGAGFCFKINVETNVNQWGVPYPASKADVFNFCGTACFPVFNCQTNQQLARCGWQAPGDVVNPYRLNILGNFRPKRSWTYLTDRVQQPFSAANAATLTNTRKDGYFQNFSTFWTPNTNIWPANTTGWTWAKEVTRFNPTGNEVENRDPLNRYSAELNGYGNSQVTAVANNARYRQIAFEGFEDYNFDTYACSRHFEFPVTTSDTTSQTSHTGKYSIQVQPGGVLSTIYPIVLPTCPVPAPPARFPYQLHVCDCVGKFSPDPGDYVFSAWVREDQAPGTLNYTTAEIEIKTGGLSFKFKPAGQVIEGWQRIFGVFNVPSGAADIEIRLAGNSVLAWFDDLRISPFDASMKSFVYDERTLRFTYELDENNFFTQYGYDAEGRLELVKKETAEGVMTVTESRIAQKKQ